MLRRKYAFLAVASVFSLAFAACGGSSDDGASGGSGGTGATDGGGGSAGGGGAVEDPQEPGRQPPGPPASNPAAGTENTVLAIYELFVGDSDRQFNADPQAWKDYGFNLDGLISTVGGTNHCKPVTGAVPSGVKPDGNEGIDNSFGKNLIPIIGALAADPSQAVTDAIQNGDFTIMLKLDKMEDPASKPDQTDIAAFLYGGASYGATPAWDGSDMWPVLPELLNGDPPDINNPKVQFPTSYINQGTWVSGSAGTLNITVAIQGFELALIITNAQVAMDVTGVGTSAMAANGVIGGVIETGPFIEQLRQIAGAFDPSLCGSGTFDSIAQQIEQASDIMKDGTNGNPEVTCDAISIGIAFTARAVQLGPVAPPATPPDDPCADAG